MCNCSKVVSQSDCQRLREHAKDGRFFIYNFKGDYLRIAYVPNGENPNSIAERYGYYNDNGDLEWFNIMEHPCNQNLK